jgi:hypothetical protein
MVSGALMATSRWGSPAPSGPPIPMPDRQPADVTYIPVRSVQEAPAVMTGFDIVKQMRARVEAINAELSGYDGLKAELAMLEKMLEVQ